MALTASHPPSQVDGSESTAVALYNIHSGCNGGLESALRATEAMDMDIGILLEIKVTDEIYTQSSSGYSVLASNAPSAHQGGIALFWWPNKSYKGQGLACLRAERALYYDCHGKSTILLLWDVSSPRTTSAHYHTSSKPGTNAREGTPPSSWAI
jgi:hypothetical protein